METDYAIQTITRSPFGLDTESERAEVTIEYRRKPGHYDLLQHIQMSQVCQAWLIRAAGWEVDRDRYCYRRIGYPTPVEADTADVVVSADEYWRQHRRHRRTGEPAEFDGVVAYGGDPEQAPLI